MKKIIILILILSVLVIAGCQTESLTCPEIDYSKCPQQKCPDLDCSQCPKQIETKTVIKYQCADGSVKDNLADCTLIEQNQEVDTKITDQEFLTEYCNSDTTTLKKETLFNENLKGQYVTWTGTVKTISESSGNYKMGVKLCESTWTWDIDVTMRADQRNTLLNLNERDQVTFKAKMKSIGGFLTDLAAEDGQIIS